MQSKTQNEAESGLEETARPQDSKVTGWEKAPFKKQP